MRTVDCLIRVVLFWISFGAVAQAAELFVSPEGNDGNPGTKDKPFSSLVRAQEEVRKIRKADAAAGVVVSLAEGRYELKAPLIFGAEDGGASAEAPVIYRGQGMTEVTGGRLVKGWHRDEKIPGRWKTKVEGLPAFEQLWVNGRRAVRARTPNWWNFNRLHHVDEEVIAGQKERASHTFEVAPKDLESLAGLNAEDLAKVQVMVFHKWDTTREFLKTVNAEAGVFTTEGSVMKSWNPMNRGCLYFFENYLGALDAPGEWFLDGEGWLYYQARDGEDLSRAEVVVPVLESLMEIGGTAEKPVKHLRFEHIAFRHSALRTPSKGVPPYQAAMAVQESMVTVRNARETGFRFCRFEHVGGTGLWFREGAKSCDLRDSRLFDLGASGVRIGEMRTLPDETRTSHITVDNCIVQSGGRIAPSAVGVWIGRSSDNVVRHCDIADFYYTAVSAGWVWGYAPSPSKRNRIENNHLHHLGYRILSDMGGVYTLGKSEGTAVTGNVIHDVYATRYGGWGLYPDEGSTGILFENNLVYDVRDGGFHQHYGRDNVVRNNILTYSKEGQVVVTRKEDHRSFTFENNIVYWDGGRLLGGHGWNNGATVEMRNNLYWRHGGQSFDFGGKSFKDWQTNGRDQGSKVADPMFVDAGKRDFRLKPDSPALSVGFKPFDFSIAGVRGEEWRALASSISFPEPYVVPPSMPNLVNDDFERGGMGSFFRVAKIDQEGRKDLVRIVPGEGGHHLEVRKDRSLKHGYNPHIFWNPNVSRGTARLRFRIKLSEGAALSCEWRGKGNPYQTGPELTFRGGKILSRNQLVADLPMDQWIEVVMESLVGIQGSTWKATLTFPGGKVLETAGLVSDGGWQSLRWLGFTSKGADGSVWKLDDLSFEVE